MLLLLLVFVVARGAGLCQAMSAVLVVGVAILAPLHTLAFEGLEHVFQTLVDLAFLT